MIQPFPAPGIHTFDIYLLRLRQQRSDFNDAVVVPEIDREDLVHSMAL